MAVTSTAIIGIVIAAFIVILFMINKLPMSVVAMLGSVLMVIFIPDLSLAKAYSGYSAPGWSMVIGMMIVSDALFQTGVAKRIGDGIGNSIFARNERLFIFAVAVVCTIMSAFMSNNGTVAIWMPLIATVAAGSSGRIRSKMVIFVAGTSAVIGGACTLVGSTSQLAANAVLQGFEGFEVGMGMFDMTKIMIIPAIINCLFWPTIGYVLLKRVLKPESPDFNVGNMYDEHTFQTPDWEENKVPAWKGNVALWTMIACIVMFVISGFAPFKNYLNIGIIGMIGAIIVIGTGCISIKDAYRDLPWDVLITIGAIGGLGAGLEVSGGGALIANAVLNLFGGQGAPIAVLTAVIAALCAVLTNFMSNNATAAMLAPIAIAMALALGISPLPWVILIAATSNFAIATSYGTAVNMQILPAGYKFMDYVKLGGPLLIIEIVAVIISAEMFLI